MRTAIASLLSIMVLAAAWATGSNAAATGAIPADFIIEYPIPTANSQPRNIVVEAPGKVWFTMPGANAIGSLTVTSADDYQFNSYPVPTANSEPYDLALGGGYIWFTERAGNKIGRLNLSTTAITEFSVPTPNSSPTGIALAPDGQVWFVERDGNKLGRFNTSTETFSEFAYTSSGGQLEDVAVASDGNVWFTAPGLKRVVEYYISSGSFINVPVLLAFGGPSGIPGGIVTDSARRPWTTASDADLLGPYVPGTLTYFRWESLLFSGGQPTGLAYTNVNGRHNVWFVETAGNRVGRLVTTAGGSLVFVRHHPLPTPDSQPRGIAVDSNGHAWITETGSNQIAEWKPPYFHDTNLTIVFQGQ